MDDDYETDEIKPKKDRGKRKYESKKIGYRMIRKNTGHERCIIYNLRKWCDENGMKNSYQKLYLTLKGGPDVNGYVLERLDAIPTGTVDEVLESLEPVENAPDAPANEEDDHVEILGKK